MLGAQGKVKVSPRGHESYHQWLGESCGVSCVVGRALRGYARTAGVLMQLQFDGISLTNEYCTGKGKQRTCILASDKTCREWRSDDENVWARGFLCTCALCDCIGRILWHLWMMKETVALRNAADPCPFQHMDIPPLRTNRNERPEGGMCLLSLLQ